MASVKSRTLQAGLSKVLGKRIKANLRPLAMIDRQIALQVVRISPQALRKGKERARQLIAGLINTRESARSPEKARKLMEWRARKEKIRAQVGKVRARIPMRLPEQVLADLAKVAERASRKLKPAEAATVIIRTSDADAKAVLKRLETLNGGAELIRRGLRAKAMRARRGQEKYFEISLPVHKKHLGSEVLNVAWALKKSGAALAAWPGDRKMFVFDDSMTHATRAERSFAWHVDMIRVREAHQVAPGPGGAARGQGAVIAHPDTGWASHPEYNQDQIDRARSHNSITGATGQNSARHSINPDDADAPNITHGTGTGCLIVGGRETDSPDLANLEEQDLELADFLSGRNYFAENPQVDRGNILGVAPLATVVPIRFISSDSFDTTDSGFAGAGVVRIGDARFDDVVDYAIQINADVMSLSVGGLLSDAVRDAFDQAIDHDMIVVAAAGQTFFNNILSGLSPEDSVIEPARYRDVIACAGCCPDGRPWDESHRGPNVDITAPADAIWVADFDAERIEASGNRRTILRAASGTSFAASITAGAAALWVAHWGGKARLKQTYPNIPLAWAFREILQRTARTINAEPWDTGRFGPGVLNVERMLKEPLPPEKDVPEPPATVANLLTWVEEGLEFVAAAADWLGDRYHDAEQAVLVGIAVAAALGEDLLEQAEAMAAQAYAAAEEFGQRTNAAITAAVNAGEQLAAAAVDSAEDLAEQAADTGEDVVEAVGNFVEDSGEVLGEAADEVASWFGF
jgi:subtilisin family serine protease